MSINQYFKSGYKFIVTTSISFKYYSKSYKPIIIHIFFFCASGFTRWTSSKAQKFALTSNIRELTVLFYLINLNKKSQTPIIVKPFWSLVSFNGLLITIIFWIWSFNPIYGFISLFLVSTLLISEHTWM